jgi:hypothetical protein
MRKYLALAAIMALWATSAHAQCILGCGPGTGADVYDGGDNIGITGDDKITDTANSTADLDTVQLPAVEQNQETDLQPGEAGGFDQSQALVGDLEQQVSSAGGMSLNTNSISAYSNYWPGYSKAGYLQGQAPPGSPEGDMATTLGTLQGALQAGADQQQSQGAEQGRLADLETENGQATGNLQVQEVSNEVALFTAQEEMKQRNATNGTLNALLVAESNRQNQKAQDDLESLTVEGENFDGDFTQVPNPPEPQLPQPQPLQ